MRLCNFWPRGGARRPRAGLVIEDRVLPLAALIDAPGAMDGPLEGARLERWLPLLASRFLAPAGLEELEGLPASEVELGPPLEPVASLRDFYAFEEHVRRARGRRGLEMVPEWYQAPFFYFSNPHAILGPEAALPAPSHGRWLDFELEVACVIGIGGRDIEAADAEWHIAGYTILNDWSLRDLQRQEMKVGLGPSKGKDFATSLGPLLVTPEELVDRRAGKGYDLEMVARVNGRELSRGNWKTIHYSFAEMIAHASRGAALRPGDVLGSGTVGTGCLLELGAEETGEWLREGDLVELEVERLGLLRNRIVSGR